MRIHLNVACLLACFAASPAVAGPTACMAQYSGGEAPEIVNDKLSVSTREVCFSSFGVMHSGVTRTPLWSAEHLMRATLDDARHMVRVNAFHSEERLPANERAELKDYSRSGYDRGHMAPSADMPDEGAQEESFSLSNMIPQAPENNRNIWEAIEAAVRAAAMRQGELYVITGPLFKGTSLKQLRGRVMVPTHIYKIVHDPVRKKAAAYLVANEPATEYAVISIAELETLAGINFFPRMTKAEKQVKLDLPQPAPYGGRHKRKGSGVPYRENNEIARAIQ